MNMTKKRLSGKIGLWGLENRGTSCTRLLLRLLLKPRKQEESSPGSSRTARRSLPLSWEAS
jgi:hypothetical protein